VTGQLRSRWLATLAARGGRRLFEVIPAVETGRKTFSTPGSTVEDHPKISENFIPP
jgi:hypothetical protein